MLNKKSVKSGTDKFFRKQGNILGINITGTPKDDLLTQIGKYLSKIGQNEANSALKVKTTPTNRESQDPVLKLVKTGSLFPHPLFITTPNSEQVLLAQKDKRYKEILQNSDISLCDGAGLLVAYEYLNCLEAYRHFGFYQDPVLRLPKTGSLLASHSDNALNLSKGLSRILTYIKSYYSILKTGTSFDGLKVIKGRDFMLNLLKIANVKRYKVFLLGSTKNVLTKTLSKLRNLYPAVRFKIHTGGNLDSNSVPLTNKQQRSDSEAIKSINKFHPQMLFVAFGAPKQEKWVYRNIDKLKTDLVMVVGSSFDYIAGTRVNVPQVIDRLELEWLWRLLTGSQNIKRIFNAVIKFPYLVITDVSS